MEFHEKLQELRKNRGLTQEELAESLYVSRTAISKWESGRGYPSIDSLKAIASFYSVTIDELLSGEKLISIAEKENKSNIRNMCDLLLGVVDVCFFILIMLPLYPKSMGGYIYSVNLFEYTEITAWSRIVYWLMFLFLIVLGILKSVLVYFKKERKQKELTIVSMVFHIVVIMFLGMRREPYAVTMAFLLLLIKGALLLKRIKADG